jgi:molybdopterin/thiamine biosynthesis adenylyltransferase
VENIKEIADRYLRQTIFPEIGLKGQRKLNAASVLVAGIGGLGSLSCQYLCRAGIGRLTIIDSQDVQLTDLNRQVLYNESDLGKKKILIAEKILSAVNSEVKINSIQARIDSNNVTTLVGEIDIVVDGTDNFETRYLLNAECQKRGIPFIYGGIFGLKGSVMTIIPGQTACLACFLSKEQSTDAPIPAIGPFVGMVASIQVMEVLKLIVGLGEPLAGKLLKVDGRTGQTRRVLIKKNPDCRVCG